MIILLMAMSMATDLFILSLCVSCVVLETENPPWSLWQNHPAALHDATGLDRDEFDRLYNMCEQELIKMRLRLHASKKQHAYLSTHNMLCLTLYWLRKAESFHSIAAQYPTHSRTVITQAIHTVIDMLHAYVFPRLVQPIPANAPSSRAATLDRVKLIIDSTFVPLPSAEKRGKFYHKKSPTKAALKVEILCDLRHRIVNVSNVVNGAMHDMRLVRESGALEQINDETHVIGDKGYIGQLGIVTPARRKRKPSREVQQLQDETTRKHELESERAAIENINERVKEWSICRYAWEQKYDDFTFINKVVQVVCALVNLILDKHPIRHDRQPLQNR